MDQLTLIGTGTCQLQEHRVGSSVLLDLDGTKILYDCGRGVTQRLAQLGVKTDEIEHIILSHFHPDHISDLIPFLHSALWSRIDKRSVDLNIYGPKGIHKVLDHVFSLVGKEHFDEAAFSVNVEEETGETLAVDQFEFEYTLLEPANNHGLRFEWNEQVFAITGDSDYHDAAVAFLQGADLAIVDSGHPTEDQLIELAVRAQPKKIVCSHLYAELNGNQLNKKARAQGFKGEFVIGEDFMAFLL